MMKHTSTNLLPLLGMYYAERERAERDGDLQRALAITHQIERWEGEPYAADLRFSNVASLTTNKETKVDNLNTGSGRTSGLASVKVNPEQLIGVMNRFHAGTEVFWNLVATWGAAYIAKGFTGEQLDDLVLADVHRIAGRIPANAFTSLTNARAA
jgi:hypothetical protein